MDSWPASFHSKSKEKTPVPNYPVLDNGILASATLVDKNGRFSWSLISNKKAKDAVRAGNPVTVFPATRPAPLKLPKMSIRHRAEQGANFLRTYVPDVEVAADLIREELTEDTKYLHRFEDFDPYVGNQLEAIVRNDSFSAFLAFPMGELSRDLNISPVVISETGRALFKPFAQEVRTFDTPILQISSTKYKGDQKPGSSSYMSVRTFGSTSLLAVEIPELDSKAAIRTTELGSVRSSDTGGKPAVDVKISSSLETTVVNTRGAVYKCDTAVGFKMRLASPEVASASSDDFWRLELAESSDTCLLLSKNTLTGLDYRTKDSSLNVYTAISNEALTSVEPHQEDQMLRLCSTTQVIWMDRRNTLRPMLAFKHGRAFDRSLEANTIAIGNEYLTILSSRKNGLLTVYDIARSEGSMAHVQTSPYCLTTSSDGYFQTGQSFFQHPLLPPGSPMTFFRLSELGSIRAFELSTSDPKEVLFSWSEVVHRLDSQALQLREEFSVLGSQERTTVNMKPAYERIFREDHQKIEKDDEEAAESFYDLVEKASSYWQDMNEPVDYTITSYDILFRSGEEPNHSKRADFLSETVIDSTRGYRALLQGRVSSDVLKRGAPWAHDLTDTFCKFDPDFAPEFRALTENLRRFDLRLDDKRSPQSVRRESEAAEQVALDLTLAGHIYSPRPFLANKDAGGELESMTKTLSLEDEPPAFSFGYVRPIAEQPHDNVDVGEEKASEEMLPSGVRLLLQDWNVGQDPRDFVYKDRSDSADYEQPPVRRQRTSAEQPQEPPASVIHQPPLVVAASTYNHQFDAGRRFLSQENKSQHRPLMVSGSQPVEMGVDVGFSGVSQDAMASTQILPGAYGGRPAVKKKVVKKRVGGF